ncbi:hypothetical protein BDP55DRAFT_647950 [Colletotrichum godetiae]|uniref:Uncharacterized protein n=1 Tax=Colletotrichum godetiae TaxID=1209918 RepID=A0AAJ0AUM1_9PEZI|nr:uncharacterized protein BDP55DRAFT_647950 [Colletotrichum godetiae]KAK1690630.1 hypothetical protein BDP55DRAFT_647950 [Colletotrichum godetiae]
MPSKDLQTEGPQKDEEKSKYEETPALDDADWEHVGTPVDEKGPNDEVCAEDKETSLERKAPSKTTEHRWRQLRRQEDEARGSVVPELVSFCFFLILRER